MSRSYIWAINSECASAAPGYLSLTLTLDWQWQLKDGARNDLARKGPIDL